LQGHRAPSEPGLEGGPELIQLFSGVQPIEPAHGLNPGLALDAEVACRLGRRAEFLQLAGEGSKRCSR
jgi:hypothetical protein